MNGVSLPNLPTDSLYKFLTVFGLVILTVSFIFPTMTLKDNNIEKYKLTLLSENLNRTNINSKYELKYLDSVITSKNFQNSNYIKMIKGKDGIGYPDSSSHFSYASVINRRNSLSKSSGLKSDSILITKKQLENLYSSETDLVIYCNFGIIWGFVFSLTGFILWFINNQVYQDQILKIQAGFKQTESKQYAKYQDKKIEDTGSFDKDVGNRTIKSFLIFGAVYVVVNLFFWMNFPHGIFQSTKIEVVFIKE